MKAKKKKNTQERLSKRLLFKMIDCRWAKIKKERIISPRDMVAD